MTSTAVDFLSTPLQFLKGVGPRKAADLKRAGLVTVEPDGDLRAYLQIPEPFADYVGVALTAR